MTGTYTITLTGAEFCEPPPPASGCCGAAPAFLNNLAPDFTEVIAVSTHDRPCLTDYVVHVIDLTDQSTAPIGAPPTGQNWTTPYFNPPTQCGGPPTHFTWTKGHIGTVYGVALDDVGNIYLAHSSVYGDPTGGVPITDWLGVGGPGAVYKIDTNTAVAAVFAVLPNTQGPSIAGLPVSESWPGLGNLAFDCERQMLYVTNADDGRIYRLNAVGNVLSTFDHATGTVTAGGLQEPGDVAGFAPRIERPWAVQPHNGRIYYSTWDSGANPIWSVACDSFGDFVPGTRQQEVFSGGGFGGFHHPVSDITFAPSGCMIAAERTMSNDTISSAHQSRLLEFCFNTGTQMWDPSTNLFDVGAIFTFDNSAGGVDFDFFNNRVFVTADAAQFGPQLIYGLQGLPASGGNVNNSILIDLDQQITALDKYKIGSVEVSCPPPPPTCPLPAGDHNCVLRQETDCTDGGPNDLCRPTQFNYDPGTEDRRLLECACVHPKECYIEFIAGATLPVCRGLHCSGTNSPCELTATQNNDGTITYGCCQCEKHAPVSIALTTGVSGTPEAPDSIEPGNPDDTWTVTCEPTASGALPRPAVVVDPNSAWAMLDPAQWISANINGPNGDYCYQSCFCLKDGFQNAALSFSILADDSATVFLNNSSGSHLLVTTPASAFHLPSTTFSSTSTTPFEPGNNCITVVVHNTSAVVTGFILTGQFTADNAKCCCEPLEDGSACQNTICPNSNEICKRTQVVHNPFTGQTTVTKCDCGTVDQCAIEEANPGVFVCKGEICALTGMPCPMTPVGTLNEDGTTTYECCPKDEPCPLKDETPDDPCAEFQGRDCSDNLGVTCRPKCVEIQQGPAGLHTRTIECDCVEQPDSCGPVEITPVGTDNTSLSCLGPCPQAGDECDLILNGVPRGQVSLLLSNLTPGDEVCCRCEPPPCVPGPAPNGCSNAVCPGAAPGVCFHGPNDGQPCKDSLDCDGNPCLPGPAHRCVPRCMNYNPLTRQTTVIDCDCQNPNECQVVAGGPSGPPTRGADNPCDVPDNGGGTVTLPPAGCEYLSPDEVHMILDGLPAGTTLEFATIHKDFICHGGDTGSGGVCSFPPPIPGVDCDEPGGTLGGEKECADSVLDMDVDGTGALAGFTRNIVLPIGFEVHSGPRTPGDPVQSFDTDMFRLFGQIAPGDGDPDFDLLQILGGTSFGLPSPGHTTLTQIPGGMWAVDSFFDITYRIDFIGAPGGQLSGMSGSTTGTILMRTGIIGPRCVGNCPPGTFCVERRTPGAGGTINVCCDCEVDLVQTGACCQPDGSCSDVDQANCRGFVCNVADHLPATFAGCYGDADGNGFVNAGDRGFVAVNIGSTDPVHLCLYDMDGNGFINAGDRGFVAANIGLCSLLPDWQNGSGCNRGVCPDPRFPQPTFRGAGIDCASVTCP